MPFFLALGLEETAETVTGIVRDLTYAVVATGISIAKDLEQDASTP